MTVSVSRLVDGDAAEYEAFHAALPDALLYGSDRYRRFLRAVLPGAQDGYLVARRDGRIAGALPLFRLAHPEHGVVLNSLPFYGSHGGLLLPGGPADREVCQALMDQFAVEASAAAAATIVGNPLSAHDGWYRELPGFDLRSERIGQVVDLPRGEDPEPAILALVHQKTRNSIRKGQKSGFSIDHDDRVETLHALAALHRENLAAIGGLSKPLSVFEAVRSVFRYDDDYRVYVARNEGGVAAVLLVFYYAGTVEYFTPATREDARPLQPMSALVLRAMADAVGRGCVRWNWGGTWLTQSGVYDFKARWGTRDLPYFYYTRVQDQRLLDLTPATILSSFPGFFVLPFSALRT